MKYTHNPKKPNSCYHYATEFGTVCKMENCGFYRHQVHVDEIPKNKILCSICESITSRRGGGYSFNQKGLLNTILKLHCGITPDAIEWSYQDQEHLEAAKRLYENR